MARVLGIDPGTGSMDLLLIEDGDLSVLYEESVPRPRVTSNPEIILERVRRLDEEYGLDAVAAPSGYGIAWDARDLEAAVAEATFIHPGDEERRHQIIGLRQLMLELARSDLPVYFTPGVIQLPSVPRYRKANRIDIGTADKLFTVAAALWSEVELRGRGLEETSFIVVEAGMAYNAAIAVRGGRVVDGVGGTSGHIGFLGAGFWDSEIAYLVAYLEPGFEKARLFQGGALHLSGRESMDEFLGALESGDPAVVDAAEALAEAVVKDVFQLLPSLDEPPGRIYLSGRLVRSRVLGALIRDRLLRALERYGIGSEVAPVPRLGKETKEAATGAALLASGYAGSRYEWLVDALGIRESTGSIFDHIVIPGVAEAAKKLVRGRG